jgi:hypothetical protein
VTTTPEATLKAGVREALETLETAYPSVDISTVPDGQGGLWVEFAAIPLGAAYAQESTFLVFNLPFNLPGGDIYPMFARHDLTRTDGAPLGEGFAPTQLQWPPRSSTQRPVTQLSRRTRGNAFTAQTAAQKVAKVLDWLETR